jgi:hypothetical protein
MLAVVGAASVRETHQVSVQSDPGALIVTVSVLGVSAHPE